MSKIAEIDQEIEELERLLVNANERRREEVNRTNANKADTMQLRVGFSFGVNKAVKMSVRSIDKPQ